MKYVAKESFTAWLTSGERHVEEDVTVVDETDELYVRYSDKFKRTRPAAPEVEQATAAPGEKRGETR